MCPTKLDIPFKWDVPFVWTGGANKHLMIEILNHSTADFGGYYVDAFSGSAYNVARIYATGGVGAATGTVGRNFGLVMGFTYAGGGGAVPALANTGRPITGQSFSVDLSKARRSSAAALLLGASMTAWGALPLPFDLGPLGASGCNLLVSPDALFATPVSATGDASVKFGIPNSSVFVGVQFFNQYMVLDNAANNLGLAFSNGGQAMVGNQ